MRFAERKLYTWDPEIFRRSDVRIALRIHAEYTTKLSPQPLPQFFEVDQSQPMDPMWHYPTADRTKYTTRSPISIPAINTFVKPDWRLTAIGQVPQRRDNFLLSAAVLYKIDYFPTRGDAVFWNGFRYQIINAVPPPEAYWQQTGVWLGISCECAIVPDGDARPLLDQSSVAPSERGSPVQPAQRVTASGSPILTD